MTSRCDLCNATLADRHAMLAHLTACPAANDLPSDRCGTGYGIAKVFVLTFLATAAILFLVGF